MIVLDTDVLLIDLRYVRDSRFAGNRRFLDHGLASGLPLAITCQSLLEVIGVLSFNVAASDIPKLVNQIPRRYGLVVTPDPVRVTDYAGCTVVEVLSAIENRMALGDAVNAVQIAKYGATASCLFTWNAKHYAGKLAIPILNPDEWWQQNQAQP